MKKSFNVLLLFAFAMTLTVWSCKPKQVINDATEQVEEAVEVVEEAEEEPEEEATEEAVNCEGRYIAIAGRGTITKLNLSNPNEVIIKFDFVPNDQGVSIYPEIPNENAQFNVATFGKYPTLDWCRKNGIDKGASFDCVRYELEEKENDQCEKVYYSFTEFEGSGW